MFKIKTSLIIGLLVFMITLVLTVPNSYLMGKFAGQIQQLPVKVVDNQGHITNGMTKVNYQGIDVTISWDVNPLHAFLGKLKSNVEITLVDSTLTAKAKVGLNSIELYDINGQLSYNTLNELGKSQRLEVEGDVTIQNLAVKISRSSEKNEQGEKVEVKLLENLAGRIIYTGGNFKHPQTGLMSLPRLVANTEELEESWALKLTDDEDNLLNDLTFYQDGTITVKTFKAWSPIINKQFRGSDPISILNYEIPTF